MVAEARELRGLLRELTELTGAGNAWCLRVLRRNLEIALLSPETLDGARNQLDFIEELAEAVWDGADPGFRYAVRPAATAEETGAREERRQAIVGRLDGIANRLCLAAERWQRLRAQALGSGGPAAGIPQPDHSL